MVAAKNYTWTPCFSHLFCPWLFANYSRPTPFISMTEIPGPSVKVRHGPCRSLLLGLRSLEARLKLTQLLQLQGRKRIAVKNGCIRMRLSVVFSGVVTGCCSRYSGPIIRLAHGHMTSNNETVYRQVPWAGNIAKTMTSNVKQFTVTRKMLTARELSAFF